MQAYGRASQVIMTWWWDYTFGGFTGIADMEDTDGKYLWGYFMPVCAEHPIACAKATRRWIKEMLKLYPTIAYHCSAESARWGQVCIGGQPVGTDGPYTVYALGAD